VTTNELLQRADQLIKMGEEVLRTRHRKSPHVPFEYVDTGKQKEFRVASLSFIESVYGKDHPHFTELHRMPETSTPRDAEYGLGVLGAIRGEIAAGWLSTVKGLVMAEVFANYIEMAQYLLESNYKDAAAVIVGSTLEEHLRQLCRRNGLPVTRPKNGKDVPLAADQVNADLTKANVYSMLDQKNVIAWLDLRNHAAHGEYNLYNAEQVRGMIAGVIEFMTRVPA
jgi:hypothetical protein